MSDLTFDPTLRNRIQRNLDDFSHRDHGASDLRAAAVAVTLVGNDKGDACFIITRRATHLNRHAGQWALPGGRLDLGETAIDAARRELAEEIGLDIADSAVLGLLDNFPTRSGYLITPVVIWGGYAPDLTPDPNEVAAIYRVSLSELAQPDIPVLLEIPQSDRPVLSIPFPDSLQTTIYAPTAALLYQFREVGLYGRPTRVDHYEQPVFAWR